MQQRTQIYLEPSQHAALLKESRRLHISLAGLIRKLVDDHVLKLGGEEPSRGEKIKAALSLIGLGKSGESDVSERTDKHLSDAIYAGIVAERRAPYRTAKKKTR